jgi:DNA polymerase-3 subunit beta
MTFHIVVHTKDLIHILGLSSSVVEKRNVIPILSNIKLEVTDNILTVTATDMDLSIQQQLQVQVKNTGALTVPAQTFSEIIRKIPDSEITLRFITETEQLEISSKNCEFTLSTLPVKDFPAMEDIGSAHHIHLATKMLAEILEHTKFAMSSEETRYNLNGVYLHVKATTPNMLSAAATDGHRLSTSSVDLGKELAAFGVILPRKTVQELLKLLKDPNLMDKPLDIHLGQNRVKFTCANVTIISKLIDGSFPEYQAFIPENNPNTLVIESKILSDAIDRVSTITIDKHRAVKLSYNEKTLEIHASGETRGIGNEVIELSNEASYNGAVMSIGFNPRYILDALNAVGGSVITMALNDSSSPTLIKSADHPNAYFVIMPVKV